MEKSFEKVLDDKNETDLETITDILSAIFSRKDSEGPNVAVLASVLLKSLYNSAPTDGKPDSIFSVLLSCVVNLPSKYLNDFISLDRPEALGRTRMTVAIWIRCKMAAKATERPFRLFDDIVKLDPVFLPGNTLMCMNEAFGKHRQHPDNVDWLLEFLGRMRANLDESGDAVFNCDVFIGAVVVFSSRDLFYRQGHVQLFPQALNVLMQRDDWRKCLPQVSVQVFISLGKNAPLLFYRVLKFDFIFMF